LSIRRDSVRVVVTNYNPQWPGMFEAEVDIIRKVFGEELTAVHHIGSTSVPGLKAKPIIDIMLLVRNIEVVDKFNDKMIELGYEPMGEYGIPRRRFFRKGGHNRTHHVHILNPVVVTQKDILPFEIFFVGILMMQKVMAN
jgi:GrpB-like predicted nucleotidyltransferase (UPF0157 family)